MTVRELVNVNERWYCDTPLLIIDYDDEIRRAMTVEEIINCDDIADRIVLSFRRSIIYTTKEQ